MLVSSLLACIMARVCQSLSFSKASIQYICDEYGQTWYIVAAENNKFAILSSAAKVATRMEH